MSDTVSTPELQHYLETLANRLVRDNPALKKPPGDIDKLVQDTSDLLRYKEKEMGQTLNSERLLDPEFVEQLAVTMVSIGTINSNKELQEILRLLEKAVKEVGKSGAYGKELKNVMNEEVEILDALFEMLEELDELFELDPDKREKIREKMKQKLKKRLGKKAFEKLEAMLNLFFMPMNKGTVKAAIQKLIAAIKANLDKYGNSPTQGMGAPKDMYVNLFGVLSSAITGSHPIPMQSYMGNGLGFVDWNPFHGSANIDSVNDINMRFGDSLGLEKNIIRRYFRFEDATVNEFVALLRQEGFIKSAEPELANRNMHKP